MKVFAATESIRFGWLLFKRHGWFLAGVTTATIGLSWIIVALAGVFGDRGLIGFVGTIVQIMLSAFLSMGFTAFLIRAHDSIESATLFDLWHPQSFLKFLAAIILTKLIMLAGLILFIVPGIIVMIAFLFVPYLVIDKDYGPIEAMRESVRITRGSRLELLLLALIVFVLNVFGVIALGVGLLVTVPLSSLAVVHAYRTLELKAKQTA